MATPQSLARLAIVPPRPKQKKKRDQKFTMQEAFDYYCSRAGGELHRDNNERALRAVAFLLHHCTDIGNESLDGHAANGIAFLLEYLADSLHRRGRSEEAHE